MKLSHAGRSFTRRRVTPETLTVRGDNKAEIGQERRDRSSIDKPISYSLGWLHCHCFVWKEKCLFLHLNKSSKQRITMSGIPPPPPPPLHQPTQGISQQSPPHQQQQQQQQSIASNHPAPVQTPAAKPNAPIASPTEDVTMQDADKNDNDTTSEDKSRKSTQANLPTDRAVLKYLRYKGLYQAALELNRKIQLETKQDKKPQEESATTTVRDRLEQEDEETRAHRSLMTRATGGGYGYERDEIWHVVKWGVPDANETSVQEEQQKDPKMIGAVDAEAFIDSFVALQIWVLSLPDHDGAQTVDDPIARAKALVESKGDNVSLEAVVQEVNKTTYKQIGIPGGSTIDYNLPPSAKPELLAVCFALLVYTYCELLEVGMDSVGHQLRDAFKSLYEPIYPEEYKDLYQCVSTDDIMRLSSYHSHHMEAIAHVKQCLVEVAKYELRREEFRSQQTMGGNNLEQQMKQLDRNIGILKSKYSELSERASRAFHKMHEWPFLRRARASRWQLTLSNQAYGLLTFFLGRRDNSLLPMSTLLQTKCIIQVEQRDPLPYIPSAVLEEKLDKTKDEEVVPTSTLNKEEIRWAAPTMNPEKDAPDTKLPFPKYNLDDEYDNEDEAMRDKYMVEFNRALLTRGFRRLEALEKKRTYENLTPAAQKRLREDDETTIILADPLQYPSILLTTLCASTSGPVLRPSASLNTNKTNAMTDVSSIWEEPGIGLCCAKLCPPDGRRVAVGCDDSAIRIWHVNDADPSIEPSQVLLGHKNGFPVFDVDWNRDGQTLLSAGGDGSVRLWDTTAEGPFGELAAPPTSKKGATLSSKSSNTVDTLAALKESIKEDTREPDMSVPGFKEQTSPYSSGAALAVYRGHVPATPVWSVAFSPAGYYFASAGGDGTARLWTTDLPTPVRLFTGHSAANVNCVSWHPNANYIITGSDDRTARLWDIQSGRTVRLLTGCAGGVHQVKISPGGRYAAASDQTGVVHMWDLSTGKKMTEFRTPPQGGSSHPEESAMLHALAFSPCGTALATGGDDATVRIWDVRRETLMKETSSAYIPPVKSFFTRQTMLLDLHYTSRNLLLGVGKFLTPIQLSSSSSSRRKN